MQQKEIPLLERVFSSIHVLLAYMDTTFNFIRVNRAYAAVEEQDPEFFIGKNHFTLYPNAENEAIFRKVLETGEAYIANEKPFEYANHPEWGISYWDWRVDTVPDEKEKVGGVLLSLINVTERKLARDKAEKLANELERRVQERTSELQTLNRELEAFTYSVSHDLRSYVRHILTQEALARENPERPLDEAVLKRLQGIKQTALLMNQLMEALILFHRSSKTVLKKSTVDLGSMVEETIQILQPELQHRRVNWHVECLTQVEADPTLLRLVFANLLGNALKFTRGKDPAHIEIKASRIPETEDVLVRICDNGAGFDPTLALNLFQPFHRLHSVSEFEGFGIGLANVKRIIERHGGSVGAEGRPGEGATFYFTLPFSSMDSHP